VLEAIWRVARAVGRARRWLTSGWRRPALWLAVACALLYAFDRWISRLSWLSFWSVLALAVIAAFAVAVWRARSRVVIEPFVDYNRAGSSGDAGKAVAPGLNDALVSELAALRELYRAVEERAELDPAVGDAKPVDATLELQDVSGFLEGASTGDATVSIGPVAVPIGMVMAMLGRLAQGPRLTGGLQVVATADSGSESTGTEVVLTAYYTGARRSSSWSVRESLPDYAASLLAADDAASVVQTAAVRGMVQELASRIFTDLALPGTRSWRATSRFHAGLKQYRLAHESEQDRVLKLRRAERALIEALADDADLPLARYNLGVVYRELGENEAAARSFLRELEREQPAWQPYYALALTYYGKDDRYADVSSLCDRVIELADGATRKAIAFDLKGLADRLRVQGSQDWLATATESRRRAVAYSVLALCDAELTSDDRRTARGVAARCVLDLGIACAYSGDAELAQTQQSAARRRKAFDASHKLLAFAARLQESFNLRLELGKIAATYGEPQTAIKEFRAAARIDPSSALCWAWLAKVNAELSARAKVEDPAKSVWTERAVAAIRLARSTLDFDEPGEAQGATGQLAEALEQLGDAEGAAHARRIPHIESPLASETDVAALELRLASETEAWTRGHLAKRIAKLYFDQEKYEQAEDYYSRALGALKEQYGTEARRHGLLGMVAWARASQSDPDALQDALSDMREAVGMDPLSSWERETLGLIHEKIGDYESAIGAYEYALFWQPNSPTLHARLGNAHLALANESSDPASRRQAYTRATEHLESAIVLETGLYERASAHYALARAYSSADEYERAVPHYRIAQVSPESKALVQLSVGEAYIRLKRYDLAESVLLDVTAAAEAAAVNDPRMLIGQKVDDPWPAASLAAQAHRLLALSFVERDVRLDEASDCVAASKRLLDMLGDDADPSDRASELELEGRILVDRGDYDGAIAALNDSVALAPDVEAYLHLARAYRRKAESSSLEEERRRGLELARSACRHADDLDRSLMFQHAIATVRGQLDALSTSPPAAGDGAGSAT
jgi:tetratricopeptide (TPR) repeat protein